jgi:hypothetical protein
MPDPLSRDDIPDELRRGQHETVNEDKRPSDAGRTTGGGSSGHEQPDKVRRDTPVRNNPTGSDRDPVMPRDDSTLKTKI